MRKLFLNISIFAIILVSGCGIGEPVNDLAEVIQKGDRILIKDRTGKEWDVTHAVEKYGFVASRFQFGLGPYAITPIVEPDMLEPGSNGYPTDSDNRLVIGTTINNDTRAYPLSALTSHEVADEIIGNVYVAVAY